MNKTILNYIVDVLMGISFIVSALSGLIIFFFLPSGIQRGGYQTFFGITKQSWSLLHEWSGIIMIILVAVHLILHWQWMVCMTKGFFVNKEESKDIKVQKKRR